LLLDEHGFRDHGTRAARTGQSGDGRQQMQKEDGQITHERSSQDRDTARNAQAFAIRHAQESRQLPRKRRGAASSARKHPQFSPTR